LTNVLRLKTGDNILLLDGIGCGYLAKVKDTKKTLVSGEIKKKYDFLGENQSEVTIAPAIIKPSRFENMVEKAVELGVKKIQPLNLDHSQKKDINSNRLNKIIISASKQCKRSFFPVLKRPMKLKEYLDLKYNLVVAGSQKSDSNLTKILLNGFNRKIQIIIGPEGGFSDREYELFKINSVYLYNLGSRRLRSETAVISSLSILNEFTR
jgi:16S rRNA (uracil1498-N3)-methyltransferase